MPLALASRSSVRLCSLLRLFKESAENVLTALLRFSASLSLASEPSAEYSSLLPMLWGVTAPEADLFAGLEFRELAEALRFDAMTVCGPRPAATDEDCLPQQTFATVLRSSQFLTATCSPRTDCV